MDDKTLVLTMEDGKEVTCDILFTYHSDQFEKDYVIFQPRGEEQLSAAIYVEEKEGKGALQAVETEEEWNMLEELVNDYYSNSTESGWVAPSLNWRPCLSNGGGIYRSSLPFIVYFS